MMSVQLLLICVVLQVFDTNHAIVLDVEGAEVLNSYRYRHSQDEG